MVYFTRADVKILLRIASADTNYDNLIDQYGTQADRKIDSKLKPFTSVPLISTPDEIAEISNLLTLSKCRVGLWKGGEIDQAKSKLEKDEAMESLKAYIDETHIRGQNNNNTRVQRTEF